MKKKITVVLIILLIIVCLILGIKEILDNNSKKTSNNDYVIVTDEKYETMLNDGGSHYNVYYEIADNLIKKCEDHYVGFKGYEYQGKIIYEKKINDDIKEELVDLIGKLIVEQDSNDTNNYSPFVIKKLEEEKTIYNEESIKLLESILEKIDNQ